jgi:peptidoglycan/LPS O-acetylase OafA/YrhL
MARESDPLWRMALGILFLTQSWGHTSLLSNEAYWSLPYEFWYYAIFAAVTFLRGWQRVAALVAGCALAGPGILIMAPIWAAGAMAYRLAKRLTLGRVAARAVWIASAAACAVIMVQMGMPPPPKSVFLPAAFSGWDFLLGFLVAANIFSAGFLSFGLAKFHATLAKLAGMTFALYLFHLPLLHLAAAYMPPGLPVPVRAVIAGGFALAVIYMLSFVTEGQKRRWRGVIRWMLRPFGAPASEQSAA